MPEAALLIRKADNHFMFPPTLSSSEFPSGLIRMEANLMLMMMEGTVITPLKRSH